MAEDPSVKWMLGTLIVALAGLLGYVVKAVVEKIGPGQERVAAGFDKIVGAVEQNTAAVRDLAEAMRDDKRARV